MRGRTPSCRRAARGVQYRQSAASQGSVVVTVAMLEACDASGALATGTLRGSECPELGLQVNCVNTQVNTQLRAPLCLSQMIPATLSVMCTEAGNGNRAWVGLWYITDDEHLHWYL